MTLSRQLSAVAALCLLVAGASGCSSLGVEPWQRDKLAKRVMSAESEAVTQGIDEHIYFSKEAASGGATFGGGGCGCN